MKILKYKKFVGLHIVCKKCGRNVELTQDTYKGCTHPIEKQCYKGLFRINGKRKTKDLKSREYDGAIKELLYWKDEVTNPSKFKVPEPKKEVKCELFIDSILMFSDWLENIDVPRHEQKKRSSKYIKETVEYINRLRDFLKSIGCNMNKLTIYKVDRFLVGKYYEHLESTIKNVATFNHNTRALKNFFKFIINEKEYLN